MFTFNYRQQLMEAIANSCQNRLSIYSDGLWFNEEQALDGYYYMVCADAFETLQLLSPGATKLCPSPSDGSRLTAGEIYRCFYKSATGRTPHPKDCQRLDVIQADCIRSIK